MKAIMITVRLWWFYLTYKGIKKAEVRKRFAKDFKGKIFECVSKTNWKKDLMKIPAEEREFFKQFVGKVGLCFECDNVEEIKFHCLKRTNAYGVQIIEATFTTQTLSFTKLKELSCLTREGLMEYLDVADGKAIHIKPNTLKIFDKPKELSKFETRHWNSKNPFERDNVYELTRAPQSWQFIEIGE